MQLKMCDIQGRLFELAAKKRVGSSGFIKTFNAMKLTAVINTVTKTQILRDAPVENIYTPQPIVISISST